MPGPAVPAIVHGAAKDYQGRIIIIGAGASGLMAANALKYMGVDDFLVLEASGTIGGRLKAVENFHAEVPLDVGAEWIHKKDEQIVKDMLVFRADDEGLGPTEFIRYNPDIFFHKKRSRILKYLYQETKWKQSTWWHWLDRYVHRHVQDRVRLNCPVKEIVYREEGERIRLTTDSGETYEADKVICTIPLAALKRNIAHFDPPLPRNKIVAMGKVEMPPGFRIWFEMKEKFYPDVTVDNTLLQTISDGDDLCVMYDGLVGKDLKSGQNILGYVAIGPKHAGELSQLDDEALVKAVLERIDLEFDGQGTKNYVRHVVQNWTTEPYILGSYSFPTSSKVKDDLREAVWGGRLLFAGEHTSAKYSSMVTGAVFEGRRAAVEAVTNP